MTEEQVIDAALGEVDELTETEREIASVSAADDDSDRSSVALDPAPQCAGCHRRGIELTLLENGKRYCERCAQEVERLMGIGPLFPGADDLVPRESTSEGDVVAETDASAPDTIGEDDADGDAVAEADEDSDAAPSPDMADAPLEPADGPVASEVSAPPEVTVESEIEPPDSANASAPDLAQLVARANREAVEATNALIPKPKPTLITPNASEESQLMERVQEQTRPARIETASPSSSAQSPPLDLQGVLSAERARLHEQREALEAQFKADVQAIDDRLVHVESLLSGEQGALAS